MDHRLVGVIGEGTVTDVCESIALVVSEPLGDLWWCGGVNSDVLSELRFFFGRRTSSFFGAW